MEFTVSQQDLLGELEIAMAAVERKSISPVSGMIKLSIRNGLLGLTSTNLDLSIKSRVPAITSANTSAATEIILPVERLFNWISNAQPGEVSCQIGKRFSAKIHSSNCSIAIPEGVSFPPIPPMGPLVAELPASILSLFVSHASFVIPNFDSAQFNFSGLKIWSEGSALSVAATDGRRMAYAEMPMVGDKFSVLIARKAAGELARLSSKFPDETVKIYASSGCAHFAIGDRLLHARALAGNFPNVKTSMERVSGMAKHSASFSATEARGAIARVSSFVEQDSREIGFNFTPNCLNIFATNKDGDTCEEPISVEYGGDPVQILFNSSWLMDWLRIVGDQKAAMSFGSTKGSIIEFRVAGNEDYRYFVASISH